MARGSAVVLGLGRRSGDRARCRRPERGRRSRRVLPDVHRPHARRSASHRLVGRPASPADGARRVPHHPRRPGRLSDHPWNDIAVTSRGDVYVNNIGFDFPAGEVAPGMVALITNDGSARQVADGLMFPNGMVVTPDDSTLIVAESYGNKLTAFDILADGSLSGGRPWAALDGFPDGICLDAEGAAWYADVPNKRCVRVRAGGEVLQTIDLDRGCFACALGGPRGTTLFMLANEWQGADAIDEASRMGEVLALQVRVPAA